MQNAGQYGPGAAGTHQSQQFAPSEPSPNGGSTTSSLRQFRKKDVDKSNLDQVQKQVSDGQVGRMPPHNPYPPVSNDCYRYPTHQFSDYSSQVKYSDSPESSQPNLISTSVIQKPKPKDYMEICNMQQSHMKPTYPGHLVNHQQYHHENPQYIHKDANQIHPAGFKPESHFFPKEQHQYQQLLTHPMQHKFNPMMAQSIRKYNTPTAENAFLNKLSKIDPSMARSIISDHHLQDSQTNYPTMDQRNIYPQQNHRYYPGHMYQQNQYSPNPSYPMNTGHYANYPSASCNYPRTNQMPPMTPRFHPMDRSISPSRRGYPENMHMPHMNCNIPQKITPPHNYPSQYVGPEYSQHYQHRRIPQEMFSQSCRPPEYVQNHHQMPGQDMQDMSESRVSPSDSLKKFIENWAEEEPNNEMGPSENNIGMRDGKTREETPSGTVYMINATDVQYFENNGIPLVTTDNGGIQLTPENYQYLLKNGLIDNSGMVRIMEPNSNNERVVNLQIMETSKTDCLMPNKNSRPKDPEMSPVVKKPEDDNRKVVIHQNTVINTARDVLPIQQNMEQVSLHQAVIESINASKELVDKNCSPINLDQLNSNSEINKTYDSKDERDTKNELVNSLSNNLFDSSEMLEAANENKGLKSMPIIDLFSEGNLITPKVIDEKDLNIISSETNEKKKSKEDIKEAINDCETNQSEFIVETKTHKPSDSNPEKSMVQTNAENQIELHFDDLVENKVKNLDGNEKSIQNVSGRFDDVTNICNDLNEPTMKTEEENDNVSKNSNETTEKDINESTVQHKYGEAHSPVLPLAIESSSITNTVTPVGKRKRIFSVDDIIHNIGNNTKKSWLEFDNIPSTEIINKFINQEIEYSSLQQLLIIEEIRQCRRDEIIVSPKSNIKNDKDEIIVNPKRNIENDDVQLPENNNNQNVQTAVNTLHEILNNIDNAASSKTPIDAKESLAEVEQKVEASVKSPKIMETEEKLVTSDIQYRRAITVEESTVLLQIAGELIEININEVNGKKVITVVPISDTTVVDYNDNYELSANTDNTIDSKLTRGNAIESEVNSEVSLKLNDFEDDPTKREEEDISLIQTLETSITENIPEEDHLPDLLNANYHSEGVHFESGTDKSLESTSEYLHSESSEIKKEEEKNKEVNVGSVAIDRHNILLSNVQDENNFLKETDLNTEILEYPMDEHAILVSDELSHEIVVSDPLEGIGYIEGIERAGDIDIQIEPVTTSETPVPQSDNNGKENLLEDKNQEKSVNVTENKNNATKPDVPDPLISNNRTKTGDTCISTDSKPKRRAIKPEVLILSPTSTNIDDSFSNCKENVYLEPKVSSNEGESLENSSAIATKAAKKSYEMDLQIPAVTTSGDVSAATKKSSTDSHDRVTSSKKEKVPEEIHKTIRFNKKSKRKCEKLVRRKEKNDSSRNVNDKRMKDTSNEKHILLSKTSNNITTPNSKTSDTTETDDEYVDFKELLKARKLKKQKKLQEIMKGMDGQTEEEHDCKTSALTLPLIVLKNEDVTSSRIKENSGKQCFGCSDHESSKKIKTVKNREDKLKYRNNMIEPKRHNLVKKNTSKEGSELGRVHKNENKLEELCNLTNGKSDVSNPIAINISSASKHLVQKRISFSDDTPTSTSSGNNPFQSLEDPKQVSSQLATEEKKIAIQGKVIVPSVSEFIEESKKKISFSEYVKRKRKELNDGRNNPGEDTNKQKKAKINNENNPHEDSVKLTDVTRATSSRTLGDIKTSFIIHSSDWEDTASPKNNYKRSSEECLIQDFSGLIKNNSIRPVIDVKEFNSTDVKLKEYKEKVDSQLSSLNIQIPKRKPQTIDAINQFNLSGPYESPETDNLVKRFLKNEKMTVNEMEKIKRIISYKRYIQDQRGKPPCSSASIIPSDNSIVNLEKPSNPKNNHNLSYKIQNSSSNSEIESHEVKLHIKKVCAKRKLESESVGEGQPLCSEKSEVSPETQMDYSVYNRLGKDGLPKMIFKRNRQSNVSDDNDTSQPVVRLERIDLNTVKEKYNITVTNMVCDLGTK